MLRWLLLLSALAACGDKQAAAPRPAPQVGATGSATGPVIIGTKTQTEYGSGGSGAAHAGTAQDVRTSDIDWKPIPATTKQLITAVIDDWHATRARVQLWTRTDANSPWRASADAWPAVVGKNGAAWGIGLHGAPGEPVDHEGPRIIAAGPSKREGDDKAPAGIFRLRGTYGYTASPPDGTKLPYTRADKLECVDDPSSLHYTQILDGTKTERDWKSSEQMLRDDALYTWVIDIAHNPGHAPSGGSCIFFHVWGGPDAPTIGCTAMAEDKLVAMLKQLDPAAEPLYVLLPRAEYSALAPSWKLPPL